MKKPAWQQRLIAAARAARCNAYAPYSGFAVGAAVRTRTGRVFAAANVENASYGLAVCAERAAVFAAVAAGHDELSAVAVVAKGAVMPCGACRQVLAEFGNADMPVLAAAPGAGAVRVAKLGELLPAAFAMRPNAPGGHVGKCVVSGRVVKRQTRKT